MKTMMIAAPHSGCGKTTLTTGLIAALRARGQRVQPFKVGPDYIDPTYHTLAAGQVCRNLDSWLLPPAAYRELFARATRDADCAVIEGVMGLYDGARYDSDEGSTAEIAKQFGAAVIVVLDAGKVARTIGAIHQAAQAQVPIYAECGGLMFLTEDIVDQAGVHHKLVGLLPGISQMTQRLTMGYRVVQAVTDNWLWQRGETMRGHEFHYSVWQERPAHVPYLYEFQPHTPRHALQNEGASLGSIIASYTHLHFLANPILAERFVAAAARIR